MTSSKVNTLLVIEPSREAPRNSEGAIVQLKDGSLFLAYTRFTSGGADNSTAYISSRLATDGGASWSDDEMLVDNEGLENIMSVSMMRLPSDEILLLYLVKNGWSDCKGYLRRSADEMRTLGERVCVTEDNGYHVINNDRLVRLSSGRIVVPCSLHPNLGKERETWDHRGIAMCYLSDDEGRTWRVSPSRLEAPPQSNSGLQEPGVVELLDGRLLMWSRTDMGCQMESFSEDGGETWSEAGLGPLKSPVSPATIKRVPWGKELLVVWNDHSGAHPFPQGRRTPLCAALSDDDGRSWRRSKLLEADPDGWYCYISMTFVGDTVVLGYCAGDKKVGGLNRLKVLQVHKDWLYA